MAAGERRVTVRGFSPGVTEDQLLLFFESGRCCPQGGDVEKINIFGETAVMTFEDADGMFLYVLFQSLRASLWIADVDSLLFSSLGDDFFFLG